MKKENYDFGYYSKLLNKAFDSLEELKAAEDEVRKAEEEKQAKALAKKADATKVEEAFKALNSAKREYNEKKLAVSEEYAKVVAEAKKSAKEQMQEVTDALNNAEAEYDAALAEFNKAHPEGFHITLKDGDNVVTLSHSGNTFSDVFDDFWNTFFKLI